MNNDLLTVAKKAVLEAGQIILKALDKPRNPDFKGRADLVTDTDRQCEEIIISYINRAFPDHSILAEESGSFNTNSEYQWVIDPLDGTTNFVHGYPSFGVSIGCYKKGIPEIGVVLELPINRLFTAIKDGGSFVNEVTIKVSETADLGRSLLVTGFGYEHGEKWEANMDLFKSFTDMTQGVRRLGAASVDLCHLACGMVDGFWEFDLKPWDTAAGILIAIEAGGKITQMNGNHYNIYDNNLLATNGQIHQKMISQISPTLKALSHSLK